MSGTFLLDEHMLLTAHEHLLICSYGSPDQAGLLTRRLNIILWVIYVDTEEPEMECDEEMSNSFYDETSQSSKGDDETVKQRKRLILGQP